MNELTHKKLVYIVDDEPDIVELVAINFQKSGFRVKGFTCADEFLRALERQIPDLVILDLMLPDIDGIEICKFMRSKEEYRDIPLIMLTARSADSDKVLGLELGADDYVTKPFSPRELVARAKAVLRRVERGESDEVIRIGDLLVLDPHKFKAYVDGRDVGLTATEFKILQILAKRKGWVFSRQQILEHLWGNEKIVLDRTIDVHIRNIRKKLGKASKFIKNVRGVGYKIDEEG